MLFLIKRFFNCDNKASRLEFYLYIVSSVILIIIPFSMLSSVTLWIICISMLGLIGLVCGIIRRGKDKGMKNDKIINHLGKISLLLFCWWICRLFYYICSNIGIIKTYYSPFYIYIFSVLAGIYALFFLFPILFLKGENQKSVKEKISGIRHEKFVFPKIGEVFNRDFFVNIFNFKGLTKREGFWVYSPFVICCIGLVGNTLMNIHENLRCIYVPIENMNSPIPSPHAIIWQPWVIILLCLLTLALCCRRLRDLGIRPWKVVFLLFPPVNIFLFILMIFGKSEKK